MAMTPSRRNLIRTATDYETDPRLARAAVADNASRQALLQAAVAADTQTGLGTMDMQSRRDLAGQDLAARERMQGAELGQQREQFNLRRQDQNQNSLRSLAASQMGNVRPEYQGQLLKAAGLDLEGALSQFSGGQAPAGGRAPGAGGIFKPQLTPSSLARITSLMTRADEAEGIGQNALADSLRQQAASLETASIP